MQKSAHTRSRSKYTRTTATKAAPTKSILHRETSSGRAVVRKSKERVRVSNPRVTVRDMRIDLRVNNQMKDLFARAADVLGGNITTFVLESAQRRATEVLQQFDQLTLSNNARDVLLNALDNPPPPNARLVAAFKKYG